MEPHLDTGCPGKEYFDRKEKSHKDDIREVLAEVIGDVPKHMKMAGENRMWLVWVSAVVIVFGGLIIAHLI